MTRRCFKSINWRRFLSPNPQRPPKIALPGCVLARPKHPLGLADAPQGGPLVPLLALATKHPVRVLDAVLLSVALDLRHTVIPRPPFGSVERPLPQLLLDVGGRGEAGRNDRQS